MGKASSTKKVQRAARTGGRVSAGQPRSLLFPGILALVVVLGVSLVVFARQERIDDDLGGVPQLKDHIHNAFSIIICDGSTELVVPEFESDVGIHTHGDGVIHAHPFSQLGVGVNATVGRFFKDAKEQGNLDLSLSDSQVTFLGDTYEEGEHECEGVDDPVLRMAYWENAEDLGEEPEITTGGFTDRRVTKNGAAITIFYGDPDADIPRPTSATNLAALGAADGPSTLEDPEDGATTTSTAITNDATGSTTTTTAGGSTTSTTAAP
jgi:hypothetical protein